MWKSCPSLTFETRIDPAAVCYKWSQRQGRETVWKRSASSFPSVPPLFPSSYVSVCLCLWCMLLGVASGSLSPACSLHHLLLIIKSTLAVFNAVQPVDSSTLFSLHCGSDPLAGSVFFFWKMYFFVTSADLDVSPCFRMSASHLKAMSSSVSSSFLFLDSCHYRPCTVLDFLHHPTSSSSTRPCTFPTGFVNKLLWLFL